jgi:O-antigen ligase
MILPANKLKIYQWGLILGTLLGTLSLYIETHGGASRPAVVFLMPIIPFGNLTFLMGILAVLSIAWNQPQEKLLIVLKTLTGIAALYALYLSQTRGAWLVLLVLIVFLIGRENRIRTAHKVMVISAVFVLLSIVYQFSQVIQTRIAVVQVELEQYYQGINIDTSVGIRLQLWKATWLMFQEHPFFGVGFDRYTAELLKLSANRAITPFAATFHHAHNDMFFIVSTLGIFGLIGLLALYLVPAWYFVCGMKDADRDIRAVSRMGFVLVLSFFVFGLTEVMFFYWTSNHAFYGMIMAILFAHLIRRRAEVENQHAGSLAVPAK